MTGKDILKVTLNLVVIYIIGGLLLAAVYAKTSPVIYKKTIEETEKALKELMPEAKNIAKAGDWEPEHKHASYYDAKSDDEVMGYVAESYGKGYSSFIHLLIAVDKDFKIKQVKILGHAETPGLGDEIEKSYFIDQFKGKDLEHLVLLKTETKEMIQAISGATISSRAVTNGVRSGIEILKEKYGLSEASTPQDSHKEIKE